MCGFGPRLCERGAGPRTCLDRNFARARGLQQGASPLLSGYVICKKGKTAQGGTAGFLHGGFPVVYDLSPGDVLHIGDAVTLTVVAVDGNLIRFGLETPNGDRPDAGPDRQQADAEQRWWELN